MAWAINFESSPTERVREGLKDFGYVEGQNVVVDYRFAEGQLDRLAGLAAELIQLRPAMLVAVGSPVIRVIKGMAGNIPIVSLSGDPVIAGFVTSLARPGGYITGVSMMTGISGLTGKRIELLKEALPNAVRIGVIFNPDFPVAMASMAEAQEVMGQQGLILLQAPVRRFDEIDPAVQTLVRDNVHAVYVEAISPFTDYERETGELLLRYRIPAVSELYLLIKTGGLISYGPNQFNAVRRLGYFVDRILKGTNPADLPVEQASKFELMINMRTAKLLDIELPPVLLARADEVIE